MRINTSELPGGTVTGIDCPPATTCTTPSAGRSSRTAITRFGRAVQLRRSAAVVVADGYAIPVTVPPGNSLVFIRKPAPSAPPVVKVATFR